MRSCKNDTAMTRKSLHRSSQSCITTRDITPALNGMKCAVRSACTRGAWSVARCRSAPHPFLPARRASRQNPAETQRGSHVPVTSETPYSSEARARQDCDKSTATARQERGKSASPQLHPGLSWIITRFYTHVATGVLPPTVSASPEAPPVREAHSQRRPPS